MFREIDLQAKNDELQNQVKILEEKLEKYENPKESKWIHLIRLCKVLFLPIYGIMLPVFCVGRLMYGYIWHQDQFHCYENCHHRSFAGYEHLWHVAPKYKYKNWFEKTVRE